MSIKNHCHVSKIKTEELAGEKKIQQLYLSFSVSLFRLRRK